MHINVNKINGKCAELGITRAELAQTLHVTQPTLKKYLDNPSTMPYRVIVEIADLLCDTVDEARDIFLAGDLRTA
jgi:predicted transcriptional regulator